LVADSELNLIDSNNNQCLYKQILADETFTVSNSSLIFNMLSFSNRRISSVFITDNDSVHALGSSLSNYTPTCFRGSMAYCIYNHNRNYVMNNGWVMCGDFAIKNASLGKCIAPWTGTAAFNPIQLNAWVTGTTSGVSTLYTLDPNTGALTNTGVTCSMGMSDTQFTCGDYSGMRNKLINNSTGEFVHTISISNATNTSIIGHVYNYYGDNKYTPLYVAWYYSTNNSIFKLITINPSNFNQDILYTSDSSAGQPKLAFDKTWYDGSIILQTTNYVFKISGITDLSQNTLTCTNIGPSTLVVLNGGSSYFVRNYGANLGTWYDGVYYILDYHNGLWYTTDLVHYRYITIPNIDSFIIYNNNVYISFFNDGNYFIDNGYDQFVQMLTQYSKEIN
jgi:hypothetical protein